MKASQIADAEALSRDSPDCGEIFEGQDASEATAAPLKPENDPDDSATESESEYESPHPAASYRTKDTPHSDGGIVGVSEDSEVEVDPDLENFRNMFTGDGSYPESFPMSLR